MFLCPNFNCRQYCADGFIIASFGRKWFVRGIFAGHTQCAFRSLVAEQNSLFPQVINYYIRLELRQLHLQIHLMAIQNGLSLLHASLVQV